MDESNSLRVIFAGTPDFAVPTLQQLLESRHSVITVYTQPDRPAGRGQQPRQSPVKELALHNDLQVLQPESLKDVRVQQELAALQADIMIVVAYGQILPSVVLETPKYGCLNVHASLLPRWRGAAPIQRSILAGDENTGVTIMQMDVGLDTGDKLKEISIPISDTDNSQSIHDQLATDGAAALLEVIDAIADGCSPEPVKQVDELACYAHKIDKTEAKIDWSLSAQQIFRTIKAFNPWPVAYTGLNGKNLRVWDAEIETDSQLQMAPGSLINDSDNRLLVACGDGLLNIKELQPSGKKRMTAEAFINSRREILQDGVILE